MKQKELDLFKKAFFPLMGLSTLVWFLIRVIPKPSRASYPCMKAAAPVLSSFAIWFIAIISSVTLFKKAKILFNEHRFVLFIIIVSAGIVCYAVSSAVFTQQLSAKQNYSKPEAPNQPIGDGVGIYPGRVVWVHDKNAANENCTNKGMFDYWYSNKNTNLDVVKSMLSKGLQKLTGKNSDKEAWNALFTDFNLKNKRGNKGYTHGEKFVIKINLNGFYQGKQNINTSPQICYAILYNLIKIVGVQQEDISIGDPNIIMDKNMYEICYKEFPDVHYWNEGGRGVKATSKNVLFASDGRKSDPLPQEYIDAAYLINIPILKKHHRAGISLTAKNHFGSITPFDGNAFAWHYSLPVPNGSGDNSNGDYGVYRCFVDIIGHKDLGGKTLVYLIDGIWGSYNWGHPAVKWRMAPFNNNWPDSIFLSQDPVAIDSVGFDFLYNEYDEKHPTEGSFDPRDNHGPFPHYRGIDDYLHQAADSSNWPRTIKYDPENDGTVLPKTMGTHEHWNDPIKKQYSRNLGKNSGIELIAVEGK